MNRQFLAYLTEAGEDSLSLWVGSIAFEISLDSVEAIEASSDLYVNGRPLFGVTLKESFPCSQIRSAPELKQFIDKPFPFIYLVQDSIDVSESFATYKSKEEEYFKAYDLHP